MLSKEEIENMKLFFNESIKKDNINSEILTIDFIGIALEYIKQLEAKQQKLIEKLEECAESYYTLNEDEEYERNTYIEEFAQEILEVLKGEKK